jgi:tetratricopeptide (TPR) repeat protein
MVVVFIIVILFLVLIFVGFLIVKARQKKRYERASALFKGGRYEEALRIFQELYARNQKNKVYIWNIGLCHERLENNEMALVEYNKLAMSTSFEPSLREVEVHYKIALLNFKIGNIDKAWKEFHIVTTLEEQHSQAFYHLGLIALKKDELQRSVEFFEKACTYDRDLAEAFLELGKASFKLNHYEKARKALLSAMEIKPSVSESHFYFAMVLEKERSYKQSIDEFELAFGDERFKFQSFVHLGNIYIAMNNRKRAFDYFDKALVFGTSDPKEIVEAKYQYANYLVGSGDINKALKLWQEIDSAQPHYMDVRNKIDIYGEINKSENLTRFITMTKQEFISTARRLCQILKVTVEKVAAEKKDFVEFIGTFRVGRDEHTCIVDIARWINQVGEIPVRELLEKMSERGASKGIFITSSYYTPRALDLSNIRPLDLIDKEGLEQLLEDV